MGCCFQMAGYPQGGHIVTDDITPVTEKPESMITATSWKSMGARRRSSSSSSKRV